MEVEMIAARRPSASKPVTIILAAERDWPNGALGGIVAHLEAAIAGKARQKRRPAVSHHGFLARLFSRATHPGQIRHARVGETKTATSPPRSRPRLPDRNSKPA